MVMPRLCGIRPFQRWRPALPIVVFMLSGLDTAPTVAMHQALLGRRQAKNDVILVASDDLNVRASRASELPALADLELDIVDDGADRNAGDRHRVARLHVGLLGSDHLV